MKSKGPAPLVRVDRGGEQRQRARRVKASSEAKSKGNNPQSPIGSCEHKREEGSDENDKPESNGLLEADAGGDPIRHQQGAGITHGKKKKDAAG